MSSVSELIKALIAWGFWLGVRGLIKPITILLGHAPGLVEI